MEAPAILNMVEDALYNTFLSLMSSSATMTEKCELCSSIHPKLTEVNFWSHSKEKLVRTSQIHPYLQIPLIAWSLQLSISFSLSTKSRAQRCGFTKKDALWLKKYWEYIMKNNREKQLKSWIMQVRFLLNTCSTVMKIVLQSCDSRKEHQNKETHKTTKKINSAAKNDNQMYNLLKNTIFLFQTGKVIK